MAFKSGDSVQIITRPVTSDDEKTSLYFSYFGGLTGKVDRVYDDGSVCVEIELESLSDDIRKRHHEMQEAERRKWLENLSGEVRNRLTPEQKQLTMAYKLLVSKNDIEPSKGGKPKAAAIKEEPADSTDSSDREGAQKAPVPSPAADAAEAHRASSAELEAKEEEYLKSLQNRD